MSKKRVLFLCTGNSCRSQMADGIVNYDLGEHIEAFSAGTDPHGLNPKAVEVMNEIGMDISGYSSDHISKYDDQEFDFVFTLCGDADEKCPMVVGGVERMHFPFDDPPKCGETEQEKMEAFRRVRNEIRSAMNTFFRQKLNLPG